MFFHLTLLHLPARTYTAPPGSTAVVDGSAELQPTTLPLPFTYAATDLAVTFRPGWAAMRPLATANAGVPITNTCQRTAGCPRLPAACL